MVRFDDAGKLAATSSDDGTVRVWNADTGQPMWRSTAVLPGEAANGVGARVLTHAGWFHFDDEPAAAPEAGWRETVEQQARRAKVSPDGKWLCVARHDERVELWSMTGERRLSHALNAHGMVATDGGCLVTDGEDAWLLSNTTGSALPLPSEGDATVVGATADRLLVINGTRAILYDSQGRKLQEVEVGHGVTALSLHDGYLLLGYADGNLDRVPIGETKRARFRFEDVPASPTTIILAGPAGTIIAGYANGMLGLWDADRGVRLARTRLHGPIVHARLAASSLLIASELGHYTRWDLAPFYTDYCELLRTVWSRVPVAWREGHPQLEKPPAKHRCQPK